MPEVRFEVEWPDGRSRSYYSPSLIVEEYFAVGATYEVGEFVRMSQEALGIASDRVQAKYGFPCSRSAATLAAIEGTGRAFQAGQMTVAPGPYPAGVTIRGFER